MIPHLVTRLTGDWQPSLQSAGIYLEPPLYVVQKSGPGGAVRKVIFLVFSAKAAKPAIALKTIRDPAYDNCVLEEFDILNSLWQRRTLQSSIPQPLGLFRQGEHLILAEKTLPGAPLNLLLRRRRWLNKRHVSHYLNAAATWLCRFQETGSKVETTFLGREAIIGRLARLPDNGLPSAFVALLMQEADKFHGLALPLVNAHGDFWPGNLLWEGKHNLCGVYDWEAFHPARPPFCDLFLFVTTFAQGQTWAGKNRAERFRHGFLDDTWLSHLLAGAVTRLFERYKLPQAAASLFYAQFLLEMATAGAADGPKWREQTEPWRALLHQYACAGPALRPFVPESVS